MELNGTGTSWDGSSQEPQSGRGVGGGGCCTSLFCQRGYANLRVQLLLLLPHLSRLPRRSRGDARPGVFNPVKPSLLITPGRASSLPAMPAAGWMLLLFLSDLLSWPQPRGTSYSTCAQPPSWTVNEASWTKRAPLAHPKVMQTSSPHNSF